MVWFENRMVFTITRLDTSTEIPFGICKTFHHIVLLIVMTVYLNLSNMTIHSNQFSVSSKLSVTVQYRIVMLIHDDFMKWTHFPRYICTGILLGESIAGGYPHKGHWRGALLFYLICAWTNGSANNGDDGDLRRHCAHYDVTVIYTDEATNIWFCDCVYCSWISQ